MATYPATALYPSTATFPSTTAAELIEELLTNIREKPPLRTSTELVTPSGRRYRWAADEPDPANTPGGQRWSDTMPGGYESYNATLPRQPGTDYQDLERLSTITVTGAGGKVAGQCRLESAPSTSGDQMAVTPAAVGWQSALEDRKDARVVYVDRDLSAWRSMSSTRQLTIIDSAAGNPGNPVAHSVLADEALPVISMQADGEWSTDHAPICEAVYDAGAGATVDHIFATWERRNATGAEWAWDIGVAASDASTLSGLDTSGDLQNEPNTTGAHTFTATTPQRYGLLRFQALTGVANAQPGLAIALNWGLVAVYGDHGLTPRLVSAGAEPDGYYASDIVRHAVQTFAPRLTVTADSIQPGTYVIPHLAFREATTAAEIVKQASRFELPDWAVWEGPTFYWNPRNARGKKWRARIGPSELEETGPQMDRMWNSIVVQYQDVDGTTRTVGPAGYGYDGQADALQDDDPDNPANKLGIIRRDMLQIGVSTSARAIDIGRMFLAESRLLERSGKARAVGHIEDDRGVLHPYWAPRAGDQICFTDAADCSYRRIVRTDKDEATRTVTFDLDAPPEGLQAVLERFGAALVKLGL